LELAELGSCQSVTCQEIIDEFHAKMLSKFGIAVVDIDLAVKDLLSYSSLVTIQNTLRVIAADPTDDKFLECAVVGGATHIVTGDKRHLLPLGSYQGISIVTAADFLTLVSTP
jgi:predicted nucleic acid-binding protein